MNGISDSFTCFLLLIYLLLTSYLRIGCQLAPYFATWPAASPLALKAITWRNSAASGARHDTCSWPWVRMPKMPSDGPCCKVRDVTRFSFPNGEGEGWILMMWFLGKIILQRGHIYNPATGYRGFAIDGGCFWELSWVLLRPGKLGNFHVDY